MLLCFSSTATAQINGGLQFGGAHRSGHPKLNIGPAFGAYLEAKPIECIGIGAYYLGSGLSLENHPEIVKNVWFHSAGIRVRYTMILPRSHFLPYGYAGSGYTWASYPTELIDISDRVIGSTTLRLQVRNGHFWEIPVGIGLGYRAMDALILSLDGSLRPSFGFRGTAYESNSNIDETTIGAALMLGASIDL